MATFFDHLAELRSRLLVCFAAITLGTLVAHAFHDVLIGLLLQPIQGQKLFFLSPLDPLLFILKVDLFGGTLLALPVISWSLLSFLKPALERASWWIVAGVYTLAGFLVLAGLAYAYAVMAPMTLHFLLSVRIPGIESMITANNYLSFLLTQALIIAAVFQIPLLVIAGAATGVVHPAALAKKRRYLYLGGLIVLAVITPTTDVFSLGVVAVPASLIFEGSLVAGWLVGRFRGGQIRGVTAEVVGSSPEIRV